MKIWKAILLTVLFIITVETVSLLLIIPELLDEVIPYTLLSLCIAYFITDLAILVVVVIYLKYNVYLNRTKVSVSISTYIKLCVISVLLGVAFALVQPIYNLVVEGSNLYSMFGGGIEYWAIPRIIGVVLFIPIAEELFFRQFLMKKLMIEYSTIWSLLSSSILFSLAHLPDTKQCLITLGGGLIAGRLYLKADSVFPSIVFHISWNLSIWVLFRLV